jgi:predicted nucleic acid-binding protein
MAARDLGSAPGLITLDTSALYALLDRRDPDHARVLDVLRADPGPYVVPAGIMAELAYLVESRLGAAAMDAVLADLESGAYSPDCGEDDLPRIRGLASRYESLPLGYADSAVIACAERSGGRVLTLDERDFGVVAREGTIEVLPHATGP